MNVTFYGTRGSIPSCGIEYVKFGGDTTCVQVVTDEGQRLIIDAGTGIRNINDIKKGEKMSKGKHEAPKRGKAQKKQNADV